MGNDVMFDLGAAYAKKTHLTYSEQAELLSRAMDEIGELRSEVAELETTVRHYVNATNRIKAVVETPVDIAMEAV